MKKIKFTFLTFEYENDENKDKAKKDNKKTHITREIILGFLVSFVAGIILLAIQHFFGL